MFRLIFLCCFVDTTSQWKIEFAATAAEGFIAGPKQKSSFSLALGARPELWNTKNPIFHWVARESERAIEGWRRMEPRWKCIREFMNEMNGSNWSSDDVFYDADRTEIMADAAWSKKFWWIRIRWKKVEVEVGRFWYKHEVWRFKTF